MNDLIEKISKCKSIRDLTILFADTYNNANTLNSDSEIIAEAIIAATLKSIGYVTDESGKLIKQQS